MLNIIIIEKDIKEVQIMNFKKIAKIAPKSAKGTALRTDSGISQRSYCATRIKKTNISPKTKAVAPLL